LRILHCIPNMAGGGAERQLVYVSGELRKRNWDVHVALLKEGPNLEGLSATGCVIHKPRSFGNHDITILWRLVRLIKRIQPDVVQTWMLQMDVLGGIASLLTDTPFVLSERSCAPAYPPSLKNNLRVLIGRHAAAIVSNSLDGSLYWQSRSGDSSRKYVIPNALPLDRIEHDESPEYDICVRSDARIILFAGRFSPEKSIDTLIRSFRIVTEKLSAVLLLCGEGPMRAEIEKQIREENLEGQVVLLGYVQNLWAIMKRADLFISISKFEGLPNTIIEAMACGCPVVVSDIPAHRAILTDDTAVFVDQSKPSEVAWAVLACLDNPEKTKQRAQKAKERVSAFSVESVIDQYETMYEEVLTDLKQRRY
jgi:glycosyltransferase involved in cell wall biosynthesis